MNTKSSFMRLALVTVFVLTSTGNTNMVRGQTEQIKEVSRHTFYDITFIIEVVITPQGRQYLLRAEGGTQGKTRRANTGEALIISDKFPSHFITNNMSGDLASPSLDAGILKASINSTGNSEPDRIHLAFATAGEITWCGMRLSAQNSQGQLVFLQTLRRGQVPPPWELNFNELPTIEVQGWAEVQFLGQTTLLSREPITPKKSLLLHASETYMVEFLPDSVFKLGQGDQIDLGQDHRYLARGYVCETKKSMVHTPDGPVFAKLLTAIYFEKLKR